MSAPVEALSRNSPQRERQDTEPPPGCASLNTASALHGDVSPCIGIIGAASAWEEEEAENEEEVEEKEEEEREACRRGSNGTDIAARS
jgi:hypothetical protein